MCQPGMDFDFSFYCLLILRPHDGLLAPDSECHDRRVGAIVNPATISTHFLKSSIRCRHNASTINNFFRAGLKHMPKLSAAHALVQLKIVQREHCQTQ